MRKLIIALNLLSRISILKTLYINFKCLSFNDALKIPIVLGRGTILRDISGSIIITCPIKSGLITIGVEYIFNDTKANKSIITNKGKLIFGGKSIFHTGFVLSIAKNAVVEFGGDNKLGVNSVIVAREKVSIGKTVHMSWNIQIMDTSFHYVKNVLTGNVDANTKKIEISDNVWIGNHVSISKGAYIPFGSIIASNSYVNKSFVDKGQYLLLAGAPAKVLQEGVTRVFSLKEEQEIDKIKGL